PFSVDNHELFASVSVGIAVSIPTDVTIADLLRRADVALYRSKADGKARFTLYHSGLDDVSIDRLDLDTALRRAVERGQLLLHYQPEIDLETGRVIGVEALLRWDHPHRGILSPIDFISLAEETGEIVNIGKWVLEESCRQAVILNAAAGPGADLVMAVNISAAEFREPDLVRRVEDILAETGLPAGNLKLEITESVLMDNLQAAMGVLGQLKLLGVRVAIDDFGTGYSSLSYLKQLPVDTLKIDQSFIADLGRDDRSPSIVGAIVRLGEGLKLEVTAEGIETAEQLDFVRRLGCGRGQGNYFSLPVDSETIVELLSHHPEPIRRPMRIPGLRRSA
ncbi:MAG: GGDEF domain-containing phosphodiesterase, partial [Dehalococcoidia bacterium]